MKLTCGGIRGGLEKHELVWLLNEFGKWKHTVPRKKPSVAEWLKRHQHGKYVLIQDAPMRFFGIVHAFAAVDGQLLGDYSEEHVVLSYYTLMEESK